MAEGQEQAERHLPEGSKTLWKVKIVDEKQEPISFPKFCVFRVYPHPHLLTFETVEDVVNHLRGEDLRYYAIFKFKDGSVVTLESNDLDEIKRRLETQ